MSEKIFYSEYFYEKGSKDTESLEKNVRDSPSSSLANFLLLYHYKKINHPDFDIQAKKTALLFNNTNWLAFQLNSPENSADIYQEKVEENIETSEANEQVIIHTEAYQSVIPETADNNENTSQKDVHEIAEEQPINEILPGHDAVEENAVSEHETTGTSSQDIESENTLATEETYPEEDEEISFEPLHTVDYFASQGIKLSEDILKNDKLVNQVKSFTAWLKTMKKIHPSKLEEQNIVNEKLIQTSAEESNINAEVLTEAMAEVLIKQNKHEKAIEMFSKLSLINPSKSAYFASRIEQIKSTL